MTPNESIRRISNGSIDVDHYVRKGRALHGAAVRSAGRRVFDLPRRLVLRALVAIRVRDVAPPHIPAAAAVAGAHSISRMSSKTG